MGQSNSKIEEDKALKLCRERKKFVRQALDGRCSLAAAHVAYIQSLRNTGTALGKFVVPESHVVESSLFTPTSATPAQLALTEKSLSQFSFTSPSQSQRVYATDTFSPTPSPSSSSRFQVNHMKFRGFSSEKKVLEKPSSHVIDTQSVSTPTSITPRSSEIPEASPFEAPPWDYFGLFDSTDKHLSDHEERELNHGLERENSDDIRCFIEEEGIPEMEHEDKTSSTSRIEEEFEESEDDFDEPPAHTLVRNFKNFHREPPIDPVTENSPCPSSSVNSETELLSEMKSNSPNLSPIKDTTSVPIDVVRTPQKEGSRTPEKEGSRTPEKEGSRTPEKEGSRTPEKEVSCTSKSNVAPKDVFASIKDIEFLFIKASESGKEVPRMLEANKLHFRPINPGKDGGSITSSFLKACFSCGDDPTHVPEEPDQTGVRYITWHRTTSSHSSSSRNLLPPDTRDDIEGNDQFDNYCMISGSHASTLDRLDAWERKLYDEVKASEMIRRMYDMKCKILRELESTGEISQKAEKTRALVKDLHSRIRVAIHRIESISNRIEELRDKELQPQLEELIDGLYRMWEVMLECHKSQHQIMSNAYSTNAKKIVCSESHRQHAMQLENELTFLSSSFSRWIIAQRSYLQAIDGWLSKCVFVPKPTSRRRRKNDASAWRRCGPIICVLCGEWLQMLDKLPSKEVINSIKSLESEITRFLPAHEKNQGSGLNDHDPTPSSVVAEDWISGFQSCLVDFLGQLSKFSEASVEMYRKLGVDIKNEKTRLDQLKARF